MLGCANQVCLKSLAMGRPLSSYWSNVCPSLNYFFPAEEMNFCTRGGTYASPPAATAPNPAGVQPHHRRPQDRPSGEQDGCASSGCKARYCHSDTTDQTGSAHHIHGVKRGGPLRKTPQENNDRFLFRGFHRDHEPFLNFNAIFCMSPGANGNII